VTPREAYRRGIFLAAAAAVHRPELRPIALSAFVDANLGALAEARDDVHQAKLAATPGAATRAVFFQGTCARSNLPTKLQHARTSPVPRSPIKRSWIGRVAYGRVANATRRARTMPCPRHRAPLRLAVSSHCKSAIVSGGPLQRSAAIGGRPALPRALGTYRIGTLLVPLFVPLRNSGRDPNRFVHC
jgi:hypothetical protein